VCLLRDHPAATEPFEHRFYIHKFGADLLALPTALRCQVDLHHVVPGVAVRLPLCCRAVSARDFTSTSGGADLRALPSALLPS
jgi:hypothetical protein